MMHTPWMVEKNFPRVHGFCAAHAAADVTEDHDAPHTRQEFDAKNTVLLKIYSLTTFKSNNLNFTRRQLEVKLDDEW